MLSRAELKQQAKEQLKGNVGSYFLVFLAYLGVSFAVGLVGGLLSLIFPLLGTVAMYVALPPLMIGFYIF